MIYRPLECNKEYFEKDETNLESCWTPVHKLDGLVQLGCGDGRVDVLGHNVTAIEEADGHVLPLPRVALHHLARRLETGLSDDVDAQLFVSRLFNNNNNQMSQYGLDIRL